MPFAIDGGAMRIGPSRYGKRRGHQQIEIDKYNHVTCIILNSSRLLSSACTIANTQTSGSLVDAVTTAWVQSTPKDT
jgi:hypothetical protein